MVPASNSQPSPARSAPAQRQGGEAHDHGTPNAARSGGDGDRASRASASSPYRESNQASAATATARLVPRTTAARTQPGPHGSKQSITAPAARCSPRIASMGRWSRTSN